MWIDSAQQMLKDYIDQQKTETRLARKSFFACTIPKLQAWIAEYKRTGKYDIGAYETVMGNMQ